MHTETVEKPRGRGRPRRKVSIKADPKPTVYQMGFVQRRILMMMQERQRWLSTNEVVDAIPFSDRRIIRRSLNLLVDRKLLECREMADSARGIKEWKITEHGLALSFDDKSSEADPWA